MIDLTSKDCTYTSLKVNEIKRLLKEIKSDMIELKSSEVINISVILFAYLLEGDFFVNDGKDLRLTLHDDILLINPEDVTMQIKFKNDLVNHIIDCKNNENLFDNMQTVKELVVGDENGF